MKLLKPKFWEKKNNIISIILVPFSFIIEFIVFIKKKFIKAENFNFPIICVGNIYIGGTGKTPLSILLASEITKIGKKTAIVRKFYKNYKDEHDQIIKYHENLILGKNRTIALKNAERKKFQSVILDDGFQDCSIKKDLNIICFNQKQQVGNGRVIPAGPLRESIASLKEAHIVVVNGKRDDTFAKKILGANNNLEIYYSHYKPTNVDHFKNQNLLAFAGIGNPENFFELLQEYGLNVSKSIIFSDHHNFNHNELLKLIDTAHESNLKIITTEKDFMRIKKFNFKEIKYLKVELVINNFEKLKNRILKLYD